MKPASSWIIYNSFNISDHGINNCKVEPFEAASLVIIGFT